MIKIAVTDLEYDKAENVFLNAEGVECFRVPSGESELARHICEKRVRYVVVGVDKYTGALYDALPEGGVIARFGVGYDGIDVERAAGRGILCCNTPAALDDSVAECALALILAAARELTLCAADLKNKRWQSRVGRELSGSTLAVIGCGRIGTKVACAAKNGFGMRVVGQDIRDIEDVEIFDEFTTDFAVAVGKADFVSLHVPENPSTKNLINAESLKLIPEDAVLINTSRGGPVDENALYDAVAEGSLAGAALDVFKNEPYEPLDPARDLRTLERIITTPHIGSSTAEACTRMAETALTNIKWAANGEVAKMNLVPELQGIIP